MLLGESIIDRYSHTEFYLAEGEIFAYDLVYYPYGDNRGDRVFKSIDETASSPEEAIEKLINISKTSRLNMFRKFQPTSEVKKVKFEVYKGPFGPDKAKVIPA